MDDLIGLIVAIIFVIINIVAQSAKKKANRPPPVPDGSPKKKAVSLEEFFGELAKTLQPAEQEMPEWPKGFERPDYAAEAAAYEEAERFAFYDGKKAAPSPAPPPPPVFKAEPVAVRHIAVAEPLKYEKPTTAFKAVGGMRMPSCPMLRNEGGGHIDFPLKNRDALKRAVIANLIFSPPRAYDTRFENTFSQ